MAQNLFIGLAYLYKHFSINRKRSEFLQENDLSVQWSMCGLLNLSAGFSLSIPNEEEEEEDTKISRSLWNFWIFKDIYKLVSKGTKEKLESYFSIDSQNTKSGGNEVVSMLL